jgi:hypothetical protein
MPGTTTGSATMPAMGVGDQAQINALSVVIMHIGTVVTANVTTCTQTQIVLSTQVNATLFVTGAPVLLLTTVSIASRMLQSLDLEVASVTISGLENTAWTTSDQELRKANTTATRVAMDVWEQVQTTAFSA